MDKVKKFLEAYVQWLALALGVAFLGWTVYGYIFLKPVSVSVGATEKVSPGDVASTIWDGVGKDLHDKVTSTTTPPPLDEQDPINPLTGPFIPQSHWGPFPHPYIPPSSPDGQDATVEKTPEHQGMKITKLPQAPALVDPTISHGHSNIPAPQAPAAAGGAAPAAVQAVDKNWISVEATLHTADLAKSFKAAGIDPGTAFSSTAVLRVQLIRQQMNVDGSWGPDTEIPPLDINPLPPLPDMMAAFADQQVYFDFAEKNVVPIVQPPFYQVLQGEVWYEPGTKNPNEVAVAVEDLFNPADPGAYAGDPTKLLPSELKLYNDAKARQKAKDDAKARSQGNRPTNTGPSDVPGLPGTGTSGGTGTGGRSRGGRGAGGGRGGPSGMAADPGRPDVDNHGLLPGRPPMDMDRGYGGPPGMPGGAQPNGTNLPAGSFDPSVQVDFKMWAHDPTVQAGKTYRYKMRYIISNPVARTTGLCNPEDLSKQFYIISKDSAWTESVNVESDTNFYAVGLGHGVHFDVFKWKDGVWQMQSVIANPGDMVGTTETNPLTNLKTDFATGWTLVDVREDPNNNDNRTVVLVSDNGTVIKKDLLTDAHSPEYRKLYLQVAGNKPAAAAAGGPPIPLQ